MSLAAALIHGYEPRILNWELTSQSSMSLRELQKMKLVALDQFLQDAGGDIPSGDLVMLIDGHDTLLQLPSEHVIKRYFDINKDRKWGQERIVTGADKGEPEAYLYHLQSSMSSFCFD